MENLFEALYEKFNALIDDLSIGHSIDEDKLAEMLCIMHIMHFASYPHSESKELLKVLNYYGR